MAVTRNKNKRDLGEPVIRKATPEEVERYNRVLLSECARMKEYKELGISYRVSVEGHYSTTATNN